MPSACAAGRSLRDCQDGSLRRPARRYGPPLPRHKAVVTSVGPSSPFQLLVSLRAVREAIKGDDGAGKGDKREEPAESSEWASMSPSSFEVLRRHTRECLVIGVARRIRSHALLMTLADLGVTTLFIEPTSPWENGYIESFNSKLRDELLNGEIFSTLREAQILIADWRRLYNGLRPHSSLGQRPPAPETIVWPGFALADYGPPSLTQEVALGLT